MDAGELALLKDDNANLGNNSIIWIFALFILMMFSGNFGGNRGGAPFPGNYVTQEQMTAGFNNQATQAQLQQIALSSSNNNYETAQLINGQTNALMQQNNTNLINAIQGFNQVNLTLQNQTNVFSQQLQALQAKVESCCCEIKTQMLQNRYEDERARNVSLENQISNYQQSQYILGQTGRWVGWAGSGSQATPGTT